MRTEDGGIFVRPDDGQYLPNPVRGRMVVKIRDEYTAGAYSMYDNTMSQGSRAHDPTSTATTRKPSTY